MTLLVLLVSSGLLTLGAFAAIAVFVILAFLSLRSHIRKARRPWPGEEQSPASHGS